MSGPEAEPLAPDGWSLSPRVSEEIPSTSLHTQRFATDGHKVFGFHIGVQSWLFCSHFLSTWNSRVFEFGAVLFLADIFPDTLRPVSVYTLIRALSAICFSPVVGGYIDRRNRLSLVRESIIGQRISVVLSCLLFAMMASTEPASLKIGLLSILCILACVEKVYSVMNLIAVERDWVVVIADDINLGLQSLNSQIRRIDLASKLLGPLAIALLDGISTRDAIYATMGLSIFSVMLEYFTISKVRLIYKMSCCLE